MLSIKAREVDEEKKAVAEYGSTDAGASLGEILGAAIREKREAAAKAEREASTKSAGSRSAATTERSADSGDEAPATDEET